MLSISTKSVSSISSFMSKHRYLFVRFAAPGLLLLAIIIYYWNILSGETAFLYRDMFLIHFPVRMHFINRILAGEFPEWYPWDGLGASYIANGVTGLFHPTTLFHLILPHILAINVSVLCAHFLAGLGSFILLRHWGCGRAASLGSALAFTFSGYLVSMDGNLPYLNAAAAIPWAIFATERKNILLCTLAMTWMTVSGERIHTLYFTSIFLFVTAATLPKRSEKLLALITSGILTLLISAAQLLPILLSLTDVTLDTPDKFAHGRYWPLNPLRLWEFWSPGPLTLPNGMTPDVLFSQQYTNSYWAASIFIGPATLVFGRLGLRSFQRRPVYLLTGMATLGLLLSLGAGDNSPLFKIFQYILPVFSFLRYPEKTVVFVTFALCMLSGFGIDALCKSKGYQHNQLWLLFFRGLLIIICFNILLSIFLHSGALRHFLLILSGAPPEAEEELRMAVNPLAALLLRGAGLALLALVIGWAVRKYAPKWLHPCLVITVIFQTIYGTWGASDQEYRVSPNDELTRLPKYISDLKENLSDAPPLYGNFRLYATAFPNQSERPNDETFRQNSNIAENFSQKNHSLPEDDSDSHIGWASKTGNISLKNDWKNFSLPTLAMSSIFSVESGYGYLPVTLHARFRSVIHNFSKEVFFNGFNIGAKMTIFYDKMTNEQKKINYEFPSKRIPRFRFVQGMFVSSMDEAIQTATQTEYDVLKTVPVEIGSRPLTPEEQNLIAAQNFDFLTSNIDILQYSPERIELETFTSSSATLFIADAYAKGWRASIDGRPAEVRPGLVAGRAILVPVGQHRILLTYRTPGLRLGLCLTALGWSLLFALLIINKIKGS